MIEAVFKIQTASRGSHWSIGWHLLSPSQKTTPSQVRKSCAMLTMSMCDFCYRSVREEFGVKTDPIGAYRRRGYLKRTAENRQVKLEGAVSWG